MTYKLKDNVKVVRRSNGSKVAGGGGGEGEKRREKKEELNGSSQIRIGTKVKRFRHNCAPQIYDELRVGEG